MNMNTNEKKFGPGILGLVIEDSIYARSQKMKVMGYRWSIHNSV
jgi:hypothetical protein